MPNWTYNTITIEGNKETLDMLMNDAVRNEDGKLQLSSWFPIPETFLKYDTTNHPNGEGLRVGERLWPGLYELNTPDRPIITEELIEEYKRATQEQKEKYGAVGWYDYNCKYFGCKWDCEVEIEERTDEQVVLRTDTPWTAPEMFLLRLSLRYPDLYIRDNADYEDGQWEIMEWQNGEGELVDKGEYTFPEDEEEELEIIR